MKRILSTAFLALLTHLPLAAQEADPPPAAPPDADTASSADAPRTYFRVGAYGAFALNMHDTQASLFTGGGECGAFNNGEGKGPAVGIFGEVPIVGEWLDAVVMFSFLQRGGTFGEVYTAGLPVLDPNSDEYVPLERRHTYTADLGYAFGELGVRLTPIPSVPVYIRVTGGYGMPASKATHRQTEEILSPTGVLYPETNTAIRDVSSGEIKDVGGMLAVAGAIGYPVPLGPRITAAPEISYYYPLTDVTPNYRWRISSAQAGIALRWTFGKLPAARRTPPPPPPPADDPVIAMQPQAALVSAASRKVEIVETVVTETFPILPYVFFDSASTDIAGRYRRVTSSETAGFDEQALPHRSLGAYYEMLNVIGSRLSKSAKTKITLNGTTDGREEVVAGAANNLARARAQEVKDYLVDVWGVDPARIAITTSAMPTYPSSMQYAEGAEENRRVEIISTDDDILHPIVFERFNEHTIEPKNLPFELSAASDAGVSSWRMDIYAGEENVWNRAGEGNPPESVNWTLDADAAARLAKQLSLDDALRCELTITDNSGRTAVARASQPASKMMSPFEVSRLSLIVFDFDKSEINAQNRRMVSSFVARSMQPSSTASIVGSTDRLGELAHNQELSVARALAVRDLVKKEQPAANITNVEGVGPSRLLYDNATPEGRYYCRTVTVEVRTPIEDMKR